MKCEREIKAAQGFLELGLHEEAAQELCSIPMEHQNASEVLGTWVALFGETKEWGKMRKMALHLTEVEPGNPQWWVSLAYATRRSLSIKDARDILLKAAQLHPKEPMIQFNLGCYACQIGEFDTAKNYVLKSIRMDVSFSKLALEDQDLASIRNELKDSLLL